MIGHVRSIPGRRASEGVAHFGVDICDGRGSSTENYLIIVGIINVEHVLVIFIRATGLFVR